MSQSLVEVYPPLPRASDLTLELDPLASLEDAPRAEWDALAEQAGNVFATWEWAAIWWRHFGRGKLLARTCRDRDGRLVGILPLYLSRVAGLRVIRFLGHGPGDQLGPICAPAERPAVARALHAALREVRFDVFLGEEVPQDAGWGGLLGGRRLRAVASPLLDLRAAGSWDAFLQRRSAKFRKSLRQQMRRLERDHSVTFRVCDGADRLRDDLDTLFRLHAMRWNGAESAFTAAEAFHRDFAAAALAREWLRLCFLEIDGVAVAASLNYRFDGAEFDYQGGRDRAWDRTSVGFLLLAWLVRGAFEDGLSEYRMLRGGEEWKYRFASDDPGLETVAVSRGPLGAAALASTPALLAARNGLRAVRRAFGSVAERAQDE
jgi:CelD/BcsL family acetyltransferase involved in cellulose biosynthesis